MTANTRCGSNTFLGNVLHKSDWPSEGRVAMLRLLSYGAEQDDIVLILHMDRKDHLVMNYAQQFDRLPIGEQESLALLVSNIHIRFMSFYRIILCKCMY